MGGSARLRVLLDTHVWIWRLLEPARLSSRATALLSDPDTEAYLSPLSVWETLVAARKGRLVLELEPEAWVREALRNSTTVMAPLTHDVVIASEVLPGYRSKDPVDRMLVATALADDLAVVTADSAMRKYAEVETIW